MAEYISKEAALDVIDDLFQATVRGEITNARCVTTLADGRIEDIPAADVRENKHGHWIETEDGGLKCSECGRITGEVIDEHETLETDMTSTKYGFTIPKGSPIWVLKHPYFCAKCGADMRGTMTNREWLNSLSDEELALWLCDDLNGRGLSQVKFRSTKSVDGLANWMKEEHFNEGIEPL